MRRDLQSVYIDSNRILLEFPLEVWNLEVLLQEAYITTHFESNKSASSEFYSNHYTQQTVIMWRHVDKE
jgi:hypothetical protein